MCRSSPLQHQLKTGYAQTNLKHSLDAVAVAIGMADQGYCERLLAYVVVVGNWRYCNRSALPNSKRFRSVPKEMSER